MTSHTLSEAGRSALDAHMVKYLNRKSCTTYSSILCYFELHDAEMLQDSLDRLLAAGRVRYDERRDGYCTCAPPLPVEEDDL